MRFLKIHAGRLTPLWTSYEELSLSITSFCIHILLLFETETFNHGTSGWIFYLLSLININICLYTQSIVTDCNNKPGFESFYEEMLSRQEEKKQKEVELKMAEENIQVTTVLSNTSQKNGTIYYCLIFLIHTPR